MHRTEFQLVSNQSENGNYDSNSVWISQIAKRYPCMGLHSPNSSHEKTTDLKCLYLLSYSPSNSTPRRFPSYLLLTLLLYFFFIFYLPRCTLQDFPSVSSLAFAIFILSKNNNSSRTTLQTLQISLNPFGHSSSHG